MKKTNLQVTFDTEKLNALRFFIVKNQLSVEDELQSHLNKIYEKTVPLKVREYVESRSENKMTKQEAMSEEGAVKQESKAEEKASEQKSKSGEVKISNKCSKQSKRQRNKELDVSEQSELQQERPVAPEGVEEEKQSMGMSM